MDAAPPSLASQALEFIITCNDDEFEKIKKLKKLNIVNAGIVNGVFELPSFLKKKLKALPVHVEKWLISRLDQKNLVPDLRRVNSFLDIFVKSNKTIDGNIWYTAENVRDSKPEVEALNEISDFSRALVILGNIRKLHIGVESGYTQLLRLLNSSSLSNDDLSARIDAVSKIVYKIDCPSIAQRYNLQKTLLFSDRTLDELQSIRENLVYIRKLFQDQPIERLRYLIDEVKLYFPLLNKCKNKEELRATYLQSRELYLCLEKLCSGNDHFKNDNLDSLFINIAKLPESVNKKELGDLILRFNKEDSALWKYGHLYFLNALLSGTESYEEFSRFYEVCKNILGKSILGQYLDAPRVVQGFSLAMARFNFKNRDIAIQKFFKIMEENYEKFGLLYFDLMDEENPWVAVLISDTMFLRFLPDSLDCVEDIDNYIEVVAENAQHLFYGLDGSIARALLLRTLFALPKDPVKFKIFVESLARNKGIFLNSAMSTYEQVDRLTYNIPIPNDVIKALYKEASREPDMAAYIDDEAARILCYRNAEAL